MKTYTITEYEKQDYDNYRENLTLNGVINNLKCIKHGYIGDYEYSGDANDFILFQLHMSLNKAIDILENINN